MIKLGITGGIGSGKSVVARLLELRGVPVYIADAESKRLVDSSPEIRERLITLFGEALYAAGTLDRRMLASLIFGDAERLARVNAIIHPAVRRHFEAWARRQKVPLCAIESAILFESGFDRTVDASLMVYAPRALRIQRASTRDAAPLAEIERRIDSQMPDEEKRRRADYVILNDDCHALIPQVERLLAQYRL